MPRGLKVIVAINTLITGLATAELYSQLNAELVAPASVGAAAVTAFGLALVVLVALLRPRKGLGVARIALYAVMLALGFLVLALLPRVAGGQSLASMAATLLVLVYTIGARGYLTETCAHGYFARA